MGVAGGRVHFFHDAPAPGEELFVPPAVTDGRHALSDAS